MIAATAGGVGLFLLGLALLSDGLKVFAGDALRSALARFTGRPWKALVSGAGITALVQSSHATTLTTIGFVSAGLMSFSQSVGVIFGANLGTTSTGWIVSQLGFKVSMSSVALPLVGVGALAKTVARGRIGSLGLAVAGFGLIFVGIDTLQAGMRDAAGALRLDGISAGGLAGRFALVGIGLLMSLLLQSSSAAVVATLAALDAGSLTLEQAAALVIGQNVGSSATAGIAAIGASTAVKRTAAAHIAFNLVTALVATFALDGIVGAVRALLERAGDRSPATALAGFHTAFNVLGVALLFPAVERFAALIERAIPERGPRLARRLDPAVAQVASIALEATRLTLAEIAAESLEALREVLVPERRARGVARLDDVDPALESTRRFLDRVRTADGAAAAHGRYLAALHCLDDLDRLSRACRETGPAPGLSLGGRPAELARRLEAAVSEAVGALHGTEPVEAAVEATRAVSAEIADTRRAEREKAFGRVAAGEVDAGSALLSLEAMRWVDRLGYHAWQALDGLARQAPRGAGAPVPASPPPPPEAPLPRG
jgi:phosphate:Na+ symporter